MQIGDRIYLCPLFPTINIMFIVMANVPYKMRVSELISTEDSYESVDVDRIQEPLLLKGRGITFNGKRIPDGSFIEVSRLGNSFIIVVREDEFETESSRQYLSIEIPEDQFIAKRKFRYDYSMGGSYSYVFACEEVGEGYNISSDNEVINVIRFEYIV